MSLIFIDQINQKNIFVTEFSAKVLFRRSLSAVDVLHILSKRDTFSVVPDGQLCKIQAHLDNKKKVFLTIFEEAHRIIVVTGGLWDQKIKGS